MPNFLDSLRQSYVNVTDKQRHDLLHELHAAADDDNVSFSELQDVFRKTPVRINQEFFSWFYRTVRDKRTRFYFANIIFGCQAVLIEKNAQDYFRFTVKFVRHLQQFEDVTMMPNWTFRWLFNMSFIDPPDTVVDFSANMREHRIRIGDGALRFLFFSDIDRKLLYAIMENFTSNGYPYEIFGVKLDYVNPPTRSDRIAAMIMNVRAQDRSAPALLYLFVLHEENLLQFQRASGPTAETIQRFRRLFKILRALHRDCQEYLCERLFEGVFNRYGNGLVLRRLLEHYA